MESQKQIGKSDNSKDDLSKIRWYAFIEVNEPTWQYKNEHTNILPLINDPKLVPWYFI